jgi:hypothetical protein
VGESEVKLQEKKRERGFEWGIWCKREVKVNGDVKVMGVVEAND